jgi:hypothetical protein
VEDFDEAMGNTDHIIDAIFGTNSLESKGNGSRLQF